MNKYQYKISFLDNKKGIMQYISSYNKMLMIKEYVNILTNTDLNISDLRIFKVNVNTNKSREITKETNTFLYK